MERFELPEGWEWKRLADIAATTSGGTPSRKNPEFYSGQIPWVKSGELNDGLVIETEEAITSEAIAGSSAKLFRKGTLLMAMYGATVGKLGTLGIDAATNQAVCAIFPGKEVESSYLFNWLRTIRAKMILESFGGAQPNISQTYIRDIDVPVPPLHEQKRLVARIESQTSRVEAMRKAQQELIDDMRGTLAGYYAEITADAEWKPLGDVAPQARRPVTVQAGQNYPELGIRSFGKGTFHKPAISAEQLGTKRLYHIHPGDLIFNNVFAWEGAVAVVKPEDAGRVGSHRFITCVPKPGEATTPFLYFHFTTEQGLHDLGDASPGGAGRNRTLGLKNLAAIRVPVPSHAKQVVFARLWDKVETTRRLQADLKADLAAYVPSILAKAFRGEL